MRLFTISALCGLFVLLGQNMAYASDIRLYDVKDLVNLPNPHNMEHAIKQRAELELKLLQWHLTEPLREITRLPNRTIQSIPPMTPPPKAPATKSLEEKLAEWRAYECKHFNRCE